MSTNQDNFSALDRDLRQFGEQPRRGWWSRNWKWFVPTLLLGCIIICCGVPAGIIGYVAMKMKGLEPYAVSLQKVLMDPQIKEAIGEPIELDSILPSGQYHEEGESGEAKYYWDVKGPKGKAKIEMQARKMGGKWALVVLTATLEDGKKIDLLEGEKIENEAEPFNPQAEGEEKKPDTGPPPPNVNQPLPE
ncbi:MAG: hypothetical protein JXB10_15535 [Pirellulales bacterium]|nr:hypothetical protein [Pirellulales bacterium]